MARFNDVVIGGGRYSDPTVLTLYPNDNSRMALVFGKNGSGKKYNFKCP